MANSKKFVVKNGLETQNIQFVEQDGTETITLTVLDDGSLSFSGSSGQLFSIADSLTGSIFSVNDISGIPSIEVFDDGKIVLAESTGNVGIGTTSPTEKLTVTGNIAVSGTVDGVDIASLDSNVVKLSGNQTVGGEKTFTSRIITNDRIVIGAIANYDVPYIAWGGGSDSYKLTIADVAYENPISIDTQNAKITAATFASNVTTGTAPLTVASTTKVDNLNADLLDGNDSTAFAAASHTHSLSAITDVTASAAEVNVLDGIPGTLTATELGYVDGVTSAIQTQLDNRYSKVSNHYLNETFQMLENVTPQYILLCGAGVNNNVNGRVQITRTTGNYQAANLDIVITSGSSIGVQGGSLIAHQVYQQTVPGEEKYDLVKITRNSDSSEWIAIRYQGNTYPWTLATFTGYLQHSGPTGTLTTLNDSQVTIIEDIDVRGKVDFTAADVSIRENKVWHEGNDGASSGLDADLLDGNHASAFALSSHTHAISDITNLQTTLDGKVDESREGQANGIATLDGSGTLTASQIPYWVGSGLRNIGAINATSTSTDTLSEIVAYFGSYFDYGIAEKEMTGAYVVVTTGGTITQGAAITGGTVWSGVWGSASYDDGLSPSGTGDAKALTVETGDFLIVTGATKTAPNSVQITFDVLNNTYGAATTGTYGITRLSNEETYADLSGNDVVTDGVLKTVIDNAGFALDSSVVKTTGDQSIAGTKTFTGNVNISGVLDLTNTGVISALDMSNNVITGVGNITINDPGPNEGIDWVGGNLWKIYESPNDLTTNSGGNLQFVQNTTRRATFNTSGQLELPVATGTAPFAITSTTRVANLNVATAGVAENISNTGTVTLATATENNQITVTSPSYTTDQPVKLLNFHWYSNNFSIGNVRSANVASNGLGFFYTPNGGSIGELLRLTPSGNFGIGTNNPSTRLSVNATAATGVRENIISATVSDDANSRFVVSNGTITDGLFAPAFGGISNNTTLWGLGFTGFSTAANDASNSSNFGLIDFNVIRTDSVTNPFNGTLSDIVNRRAFTFRNNATNLMTIMPNGNVGIGTSSPSSRLSVSGGNVIFTKDGHTTGSDNFSLELYSPTLDAVREVSIRFHQGGRWYHQIRSSGSGFRFTQGNNANLVDLIANNVNIASDLIHDSDTDTKITMTDDAISIQAGGEEFIKITEDGTQDIIKLGDGGDIDVNLNDDVFVEGSSGNVGIGTTSFIGYVSPTAFTTFRNIISLNDSSTSIASTLSQFAIDNLDQTANNYSKLAFTTNDGTNRVVSAGIYTQITARSASNWTTSNLQFLTGTVGSAPTEKLRITDDGKVGIGITSPSEKLHVIGKTYLSGGSAAWSETTQGTARGTLHLGEASSTEHFGTAITFGARDSSSGTTAQAGIYTRTSGNYGTKMYFSTTGSYATGSQTRMMINHDGKVGIGTVAPTQELELSGDFRLSGNISRNVDNSEMLIFGGQGQTNGSYLQLYGNTRTSREGAAEIVVRQNANSYFQITTYDGASTWTPRVKVLPDGKVGIGTTTPAEKLSVEGDAYVKDRLRVGLEDATHDSIYLENSVTSPDGRNGLYSNNGDQIIAGFDDSNNSYHYANSNIVYTESTDTTEIKGNLTVNGNIINTGSTVTVNSTTVTVNDKNLELGSIEPKTGLVATLATGTANITLTTGTTEGMIPGQALTKTAGTGAFGTNARIATITGLTTLTATVNHATAGSTTFTASGATNFTADGGGITVKGDTDHKIEWNKAYFGGNGAWTFPNERLYLLNEETNGDKIFIEDTDLEEGSLVRISSSSSLPNDGGAVLLKLNYSATTSAADAYIFGVDSNINPASGVGSFSVAYAGRFSASGANTNYGVDAQAQALNSGNTAYGLVASASAVSGASAYGIASSVGGPSTTKFTFYGTGGTLYNSGSVGIGTDAPLNKLDIRITGADSNDGIMISREDTTTVANEILGGIGFDSTDGNVPSSVLEASAYIAAFAAEDHSTGDKGGYLTFGTAPIDQDDDTASVERMRIAANGFVGINTNNPIATLHVDGETLITNTAFFQPVGSGGNRLYIGNANLFGTTEMGLYENGGDAALAVYNPANTFMYYGNGQIIVDVGVGNVGIGTVAAPSAKLDVVGSVKHTGLTMTSGTNVDQLKETTFTSALTTAWTDVTGVSGTYLATGSYIVQIISNGEYYTGEMSWFSGTTTSTVADEIVLHRAGPAASAGRIYARVIRTSSAPSTLKLQVSGSTSISSHTMTFKFRRTI